MNPRTTGLLFLAALALGAFVWFYEIEGEQERQAAEEATRRLFSVEQAAIDAISLVSEEGTPAVLRRVDGRWRLAEPVDFPADTFAADGIAAALAQIASESVIEEPRAREVYGLDDDATVVGFRAGGVDHELRLGDKTPVGANHYATVEGGTDVYTVPSFRVTALRKPLDALRDKRIVDFDPQSATRVVASWPDGRIEIERREGGWRIVSPIDAEADDANVEDLLSKLSFLRATGFVDDPHAAFSDTFAFAAEVELAPADPADTEGEPEATTPRVMRVAIGSETEDGTRLVQGAERSLYTISADVIDGFARRVVDYRFRQLASFFSGDAGRVEIGFASRAGESVVVTAVDEDGAWVTTPDPVASDKIADLVSTLADLRADDILADAMGADELIGVGLDPPRASLRVLGAGDEPTELARVEIGRIRSEGIVARIPDRETIFELDIALAEHIPVSLEAFRNRFVDEPTEPAPPVDPATTPPAPE